MSHQTEQNVDVNITYYNYMNKFLIATQRSSWALNMSVRYLITVFICPAVNNSLYIYI